MRLKLLRLILLRLILLRLILLRLILLNFCTCLFIFIVKRSREKRKWKSDLLNLVSYFSQSAKILYPYAIDSLFLLAQALLLLFTELARLIQLSLDFLQLLLAVSYFLLDFFLTSQILILDLHVAICKLVQANFSLSIFLLKLLEDSLQDQPSKVCDNFLVR